ncbi:MAG: NYN domain-containing protein [Candidatus Woesearchaeota archaeon]
MKSQLLYKNQRIGVFVDVQNLYYSARALYQQKVNFEAVLKEAIGNRTLIRAIAYVVKTEEFKEKTFFEALERIGYEIKAKDLQIFYGGAKKADWDIGLAMDAIELASKLDVVVLVSGDGDYIPLVQHLRRAFGCKVEGMAFGRSCSSKLKEEVDVFTDLDNDKKYLRKSPPLRKANYKQTTPSQDNTHKTK